MLSGCVSPVAIAGDNISRSNCENSQQANVFRIAPIAVIQRDQAPAGTCRFTTNLSIPGGAAMATVLIIGASRGIGLEAVRAALEAGHSVRALARSARRIRLYHPKLEKMAGDALAMATVKRALIGVDVVVQSLGVAAGLEAILKPTRFFSQATRVLVTAMEEAQVKRLICVTGFPGISATFQRDILRRRF
jgi:putative NAD(P)-binding protein